MTNLSKRLLKWYAGNARKLPWRDHPDPYAVWVSEIMLQQTRVDTVIPYFERWMKRFPSVDELAGATEQEVLLEWEGLGYYSRARNLHKCAGIIMERFDGKLPSDVTSLQKLPGIGRYTAGAIASMAFSLDAATLDANLRRVFARIFNVETPADTPTGRTILWELAEQNLPHGHAGDYNQALMDLGASICLPRNPACGNCPLIKLCRAHAEGTQHLRPVLKPKPNVPHYTVTAAILRRNSRVLLAKRPPKGLLGGMWEFPGGKVEEGETLQACLEREIMEETGSKIRVGEACGEYQHAYTHFSITLHAFNCVLLKGEPRPIIAAELAWVRLPDLDKYPMGKVDRQIARQLIE